MRKLRMLIIPTVAIAIIGAAGLWHTALPCDTWVAMQDATADGSVILGKNSDRPPMEAQPLVHFPRMKHRPGEKVKCTYIEIPQVPETYEHIGSRIWWTFGYEHGMNEYGVAIGNEALWSKEPYQWGDGLLGMDLLRLALERGKTAYEAMHVIIDLLEKYGQSGDCEYQGEWGKANYHNSFIIADPKEAWVLETAGRYWAAKRLTHGVYSISNIYSIENDWDEAHPRLVELLGHALYARFATIRISHGGLYSSPSEVLDATASASSLLGQFLSALLQCVQAFLLSRPQSPGQLCQRYQHLFCGRAFLVG